MPNISNINQVKDYYNNKIVTNATMTGTQTFDLSVADYFKVIATGNTTISFTNALTNKYNVFMVEITNGGKYTITWPAGVSIPVVLNNNGTDILAFVSSDGVTWTCNLVHDDTSSAQLLNIPSTPGISSPTALATNVSLTPTLTTTAYAITGSTATHVATDWQMSTTVDFTNLIIDIKSDTVNKISYTVSPALTINTMYYVRVRFKNSDDTYTLWSGVSSFTTVVTASGEAIYTTPGTYSWTCPAGVTSVSVVTIDAGIGLGGYNIIAGGKGGNLAYISNAIVTPGTSYTIKVGISSLTNADTLSSTTITGTQVSFSGGNPGSQGNGPGGGGGAAGYSGDGGKGQSADLGGETIAGTASTGGGGAGGAGGGNMGTSTGGGGVGLYGLGSNGVYPNGGGSGGTNGTYGGAGGTYGGGAGGAINSNRLSGGSGAVRIIWGTGRSFPNNAA